MSSVGDRTDGPRDVSGWDHREETKSDERRGEAPVAIVGGGTKFGTLEPLHEAIARIAAGEEEPVSISLG